MWWNGEDRQRWRQMFHSSADSGGVKCSTLLLLRCKQVGQLRSTCYGQRWRQTFHSSSFEMQNKSVNSEALAADSGGVKMFHSSSFEMQTKSVNSEAVAADNGGVKCSTLLLFEMHTRHSTHKHLLQTTVESDCQALFSRFTTVGR